MKEAAAFFHSNAKRGNMIMLLYVEQPRNKKKRTAEEAKTAWRLQKVIWWKPLWKPKGSLIRQRLLYFKIGNIPRNWMRPNHLWIRRQQRAFCEWGKEEAAALPVWWIVNWIWIEGNEVYVKNPTSPIKSFIDSFGLEHTLLYRESTYY